MQSQYLEGTGAALGPGFRNRASTFLVLHLRRKYQKIIVKCVCAGLYKGCMGGKGKESQTGEKSLKTLLSSVFR